MKLRDLSGIFAIKDVGRSIRAEVIPVGPGRRVRAPSFLAIGRSTTGWLARSAGSLKCRCRLGHAERQR